MNSRDLFASVIFMVFAVGLVVIALNIRKSAIEKDGFSIMDKSEFLSRIFIGVVIILSIIIKVLSL